MMFRKISLPRGAAARARRSAEGAVLAGYHRPDFFQRNRRKLLSLFLFFNLFYAAVFAALPLGAFFTLASPILVPVLLIIWLLPESDRVPMRLLNFLFLGFFVGYFVWPDYLAVAIPSLPWITALRLFSTPLALLLLVSMSMSPALRARTALILSHEPTLWKLMAAFVAIAFFSIFVSKDIALSVNKYIVAGLYWFQIFILAAILFSEPGRLTVFYRMLLAAVVFVCVVGFLEAQRGSVLWAGHVPSFLKVEDPAVQRALAGSSRAGVGVHRVQSKFSTPLGIAEFLALCTPFIIHLMVTGKSYWRLLGAIMIPAIFQIITYADSRLGFIGYFMSMLLYLLAWSARYWKRHPLSPIGPAMTLSFPAVFGAFVIASLFVARLRVLVWGNGSQQASNDGRREQVMSGVPIVFKEPWGHGIGRSAQTLGYTNSGGTLTIDTYYLSVALEFGVIGFIVYYAIWVTGIARGARLMFRANDPETDLILPIAISLCNFLVIKSILSVQENHPLMFALLGAVAAISYRIATERPPAARLRLTHSE